MATTVMDLVYEAKSRIENLTPDDFARELERDGVVIVDLRESAERELNGSIPGALAVPRGVLEFQADPGSPSHKVELEPSARVLLFCASGGRSALASAALIALGYTDVAHLDGGFNAWSEAGGAIVTAG